MIRQVLHATIMIAGREWPLLPSIFMAIAIVLISICGLCDFVTIVVDVVCTIFPKLVPAGSEEGQLKREMKKYDRMIVLVELVIIFAVVSLGTVGCVLLTQ